MNRIPSSRFQAPAAFTPGPLRQLFADRRDIQFWQTEGMQHAYLFWVRAMVTTKTEPPPLGVASTSGCAGIGWAAAHANARRAAYRFLATAWNYPSRDLCAECQNQEFGETLRRAWKQLTGDAHGQEMLAIGYDLQLESMRAEYTRLFYDSYLPFIPPYESVYCNERQVMGQRAAAVVGYYERAGLAADGEMPDHIAHECEFVAHLADDECAALAEGDLARATSLRELQFAFLQEHLLTWGGKFCADLACLARGDFYAATARLGSAIFASEAARIDLMYSEPEHPATLT